ncbi:MAG: HNH endonuclease [Thioalkalivibrio sp.]|nr:HNH endonuclease [Thioalkalivibrio sp.]
MTTPSHELRETIIATLTTVHPRPMRVQELYRAVERAVVFDADDLRAPTVRGGSIKEPSWKRNVRNVLQHHKRAGTLVNIAHDEWRLPTPDQRFWLDEERAWEEVLNAAESALNRAYVYESTKHGQRYRVIEVHAEKLLIERIDSREPETLTAGEVRLAAQYLNAAGGRVGRRTLIYTVAKEVTLVHLHPQLVWSDDNDWIQVVGAASGQVPAKPHYHDFGEAPDDDPARLALFARRVRRGQPRFRKKLLGLYGGRCAVSGWGPESVLEAAHILLHARSGLNRSENGILLRADLHSLFDDGLLKIDPSTLSIVLHPSLRDGPYAALNGTTLRPRVDASQPSREYLRERWEAPPAGSP